MSSKMNSYYYTGYEVDDEPSDEENENHSSANGSDDEIEKDFGDYKKPINKNKVVVEQFEKDMEFSLNSIISNLEKNQPEVKDDVVEEESDTDSEQEEATGKRVTKKRQHFTNDELFYDPDMDDADEKWMNEQRLTFQNYKKEQENKSSSSNARTQKPPESDAVLNCPCCMTLLCMDCQRHETYKCQYRAMFVFNCKLDETELLKYPKETHDKRKFKKKIKKSDNTSSNDNNMEYDEYKAVHCSTCNTQVGVFEHKEELYHFFNVLASH